MFFRYRFGYDLFFLVLEGILGAYLFYRRCGKDKRSLSITALFVLFGTALSFVSMTQPIVNYLLVILIPAFFGFILQYAFPDMTPQPDKKSHVFFIITTVLCCFGMIYTVSENVTIKTAVSYTRAVSRAIIYNDLTQKSEYEQEIERLAEHIPKQDRDSVYPLHANPKFFVYADLTPCKRMFMCQSLFTDISKDYAAEFLTYFTIEPPNWLITEEPLEDIDLCGAGTAITDRYKLVDHAAGYYLYKRSTLNEIH